MKREKSRDSIDFGTMNIPKLFGKIFIPTLLGMIFNAALTVTDGIFVGQGVGSDALAAVNIVAPLFMITTGIGLMFGIGSSVVVAIHLSKNNIKAANINITQAIIASSLLMLTISIVGFTFCPFFVRLLGSTDRLMSFTTEYFYYFVPSCIFLMLSCIGMFIIRLDGSPKYAMMCNIVPAIVNVVLDYIFVFPFGWGLKGAALATDAGVLLGSIMVVVYLFKFSEKIKLHRLKLSCTSLQLTARNVSYMLKLGSSAMLGELAIAVMMFTGNYVFVNSIGEDGVAAYSVVCYLFPVVFMINNAIAQSTQPIISYNHGINNSDRIKSALKISILAALSCGILSCLVLTICRVPIVGIFLNESSASYNIAINGIPYFAIGFVFLSLNITFVGYFQSIEKARRATVFTILRGFIFLIPAFLFLPNIIGTKGMWLAIPCAETLTFSIIAAIYIYHKHSGNKTLVSNANN